VDAAALAGIAVGTNHGRFRGNDPARKSGTGSVQKEKAEKRGTTALGITQTEASFRDGAAAGRGQSKVAPQAEAEAQPRSEVASPEASAQELGHESSAEAPQTCARREKTHKKNT
jgi:hypothetical protein